MSIIFNILLLVAVIIFMTKKKGVEGILMLIGQILNVLTALGFIILRKLAIIMFEIPDVIGIAFDVNKYFGILGLLLFIGGFFTMAIKLKKN